MQALFPGSGPLVWTLGIAPGLYPGAARPITAQCGKGAVITGSGRFDGLRGEAPRSDQLNDALHAVKEPSNRGGIEEAGAQGSLQRPTLWILQQEILQPQFGIGGYPIAIPCHLL